MNKKIIGIFTAILMVFSSIMFNIYSTSEETIACNDIYLNICFDSESIYYKANLEKEMTIKEDYEIVKLLKTMEEQNITIYGNSQCPYCQKQLEEFGDYKDYLILKGLYIDCYENYCPGIKSVPIWKKDNETIYVGYLNIN